MRLMTWRALSISPQLKDAEMNMRTTVFRSFNLTRATGRGIGSSTFWLDLSTLL